LPDFVKSHTLLSPSGAFRWLRCALYCRVALSGEFRKHERPPGLAAIIGTEKHAIMESFFRRILPAAPPNPPESWLKEAWESSLERALLPESEADFLSEFLGSLAFSKDFLIEENLPIPGIFAGGVEQIVRGTVDLAFYYRDTETLKIIDWKFGRRKVLAHNNPQLSLYSKAAALKFAKPVKALEKFIVQPAITHCDKEEKLKPNFTQKVAAAYQGGQKAPATAGDWCEFCELQRLCPKYIKRERCSREIAPEFRKILADMEIK